MTPTPYTTDYLDTLVQQTTADYLERLGWESVYAYNREDFGPESLLGRASDRDVVLERPLRAKLAEPGSAGWRVRRRGAADHRCLRLADPGLRQP